MGEKTYTYFRRAQYHETDQMGIIHHSNYVKWMEEARINCMDEMGFSYRKVEELGIISPVVDISVSYKKQVSFDDEIEIRVSVKKYNGVTAQGLVESALDKVAMLEKYDFHDMVVSIKSSDVLMCAEAYRLVADKINYPLHVGITEAGTVFSGNIKSAVGLGIILNQGIGDTIRVSLTGDPVNEIASAKLILKTLGLRSGGIEVVSCPTCGRTNIDLIPLASQVETMAADFENLNLKVAVMGCVVNGPGEAKEADVGIAGGNGERLLIKKGEVVKKVKEDELLETLRQELLHWNE